MPAKNINPEQVHAAARVFYEDQTGADNYDTSAYRASWYRVAERALDAALGVTDESRPHAPVVSARPGEGG